MKIMESNTALKTFLPFYTMPLLFPPGTRSGDINHETLNKAERITLGEK